MRRGPFLASTLRRASLDAPEAPSAMRSTIATLCQRRPMREHHGVGVEHAFSLRLFAAEGGSLTTARTAGGLPMMHGMRKHRRGFIVCMCAFVHAHVFELAHVCIHACMYACAHVCIPFGLLLCACVLVCICVLVCDPLFWRKAPGSFTYCQTRPLHLWPLVSFALDPRPAPVNPKGFPAMRRCRSCMLPWCCKQLAH